MFEHNCFFQKDQGKTASGARILSPYPTQRPLPCLLIKSFFYGVRWWAAFGHNSGLCLICEYVAFGIMLFGIMSHSGLCTYFGIMLFGIMSHLGLCPIRNYIAFRLMSLGAMSFRLMLFGAMSFDLLSENRFFLFFNFSPRQRSTLYKPMIRIRIRVSLTDWDKIIAKWFCWQHLLVSRLAGSQHGVYGWDLQHLPQIWPQGQVVRLVSIL